MKPLAGNSNHKQKADLVEGVNYDVALWLNKVDDDGSLIELPKKEQDWWFSVMAMLQKNSITFSATFREKTSVDKRMWAKKGSVKLFPKTLENNDG